MLKAGERGFTLIELVVTMAFLGIVLVSVSGMFAALRQTNTEANNYTIASEVAQQLVEEYRNLPYANISAGTKDVTSYLSSYPSLKTPRSATVVVTQVDPNGLLSLDVTVSYTARTGVKKVEYTTLISNQGMNH